MHYLLTGHTGFKGSWLTLLLAELGNQVSGIALNPDSKSLFNQVRASEFLKNDTRVNILDVFELTKAIKKIKPEVIIHFAAQSLVGESYRFPYETFNTNTLGTLNVLSASQDVDSVKAILIVTTDKVYENRNEKRAFVESDPLGANDPYGSSKAAADILSQSWAKSIGKVPTAIARAGNVIGGGDWSKGRLVPDIVKSLEAQTPLLLRFPDSVRPWQHVLDCLQGYLSLIDHQLSNEFAQGSSWNFGPLHDGPINVLNFVQTFSSTWNNQFDLETKIEFSGLSENDYLMLDSSKSREKLNWRDNLTFEESVSMCVAWYKEYRTIDPRLLTLNQIRNFLLAR